MTVRCPKCRKKHAEPCPNRCGCGESLVAVLAAARRAAVVAGTAAAQAARRDGDNAWTLPVRLGPNQPAVRTPVELTENEW